MPAKLVPAGFRRGADIQAFPLNSRQKHAGMTNGISEKKQSFGGSSGKEVAEKGGGW